MKNNYSAKFKKIFVAVVIVVICVTGCGPKHVEGAPDVVGSFKLNRDVNLLVVANRDVIEDEVGFAKLLVDMCVDNAFHSTKFTNRDGYATSLDMDVYLWEDEVEGHEPVMNVEYKPIEYGKDYDIVNNPEMFELFIDGEKV